MAGQNLNPSQVPNEIKGTGPSPKQTSYHSLAQNIIKSMAGSRVEVMLWAGSNDGGGRMPGAVISPVRRTRMSGEL